MRSREPSINQSRPLGTGVDGEAAVTAGHRPECINDTKWACTTRRLAAGCDRTMPYRWPGSKPGFPYYYFSFLATRELPFSELQSITSCQPNVRPPRVHDYMYRTITRLA